MIIFTIFRTLGWIELQWERQWVKANSEKIQPEWVEKHQSQEKKSWNRISPNRYSLVLFKYHFGNKAFSDTLRKILESIQRWWLRITKKKIHFFLEVDQYIQSGDVTIINFWQENVFLRQLPRHSCPEAQIYKYISNNAPKRIRWTSVKV